MPMRLKENEENYTELVEAEKHQAEGKSKLVKRREAVLA